MPEVRVARTRAAVPIKVRMDVSVESVRGPKNADEFFIWLQQAIQHYYEFRAGFIGIGADGKLTPPVVTRVPSP